MRVILSFLACLIMCPAFASEPVDVRVVQCSVGVQDYLKMESPLPEHKIDIPVNGAEIHPAFLEMTYLDKELLLRVDVEKQNLKSRFKVELYDNIAIGELDPQDHANFNQMWLHSLGANIFEVEASIPRTTTYAKVLGGPMLGAYVDCHAGADTDFLNGKYDVHLKLSLIPGQPAQECSFTANFICNEGQFSGLLTQDPNFKCPGIYNDSIFGTCGKEKAHFDFAFYEPGDQLPSNHPVDLQMISDPYPASSWEGIISTTAGTGKIQFKRSVKAY
jgi:hypothetical protein